MAKALIGTRNHAAMALGFVREGRYVDEFKPAGSGAFRQALLHVASNVLYKVEHERRSDCPGYSNTAEVRNAAKMRRMSYPDGWWSARVRIPKVSGFRINGSMVVAMEYIDGQTGWAAMRDNLVHEDAIAELYWLNVDDMHGKNWMFKDGVIYPVDLASTFRPKEENYIWPEERRAREEAEREAWRIEREKRFAKQRAEQEAREARGFCRCGCGVRL